MIDVEFVSQIPEYCVSELGSRKTGPRSKKTSVFDHINKYCAAVSSHLSATVAKSGAIQQLGEVAPALQPIWAVALLRDIVLFLGRG